MFALHNNIIAFRWHKYGYTCDKMPIFAKNAQKALFCASKIKVNRIFAIAL